MINDNVGTWWIFSESECMRCYALNDPDNFFQLRYSSPASQNLTLWASTFDPLLHEDKVLENTVQVMATYRIQSFQRINRHEHTLPCFIHVLLAVHYLQCAAKVIIYAVNHCHTVKQL